MNIQDAMAKDPLMRRLAAISEKLSWANFAIIFGGCLAFAFLNPHHPDPARGFVRAISAGSMKIYVTDLEAILFVSTIALLTVVGVGFSSVLQWVWRRKWRHVETGQDLRA